METLRELMDQGALAPLVAQKYPLDRIAEAHAVADAGSALGAWWSRPSSSARRPALEPQKPW